MSEGFRIWLDKELDQRNWSYRKLAREAGVSHALVSRILSGKTTASADFCIKVAEVTEVSPEMLLRLAGILPPVPPVLPSDDPTLKELIELVRNLSSEQRQEALRYIRYLYQQTDHNKET